MTKTMLAMLPNPGEYVAWVKTCRGYLRQGTRVRLAWNGPELTEAGFAAELRLALHRRINLRGGIGGVGRKWSAAYQIGQMRSCQAVRAYAERRIVQSGSGIETPEIRRRFPAVHAAMTAWREVA